MTVQMWLAGAIADAERRNLTELTPLLEALARATTALREADDELRAAEARTGPNQPPPWQQR